MKIEWIDPLTLAVRVSFKSDEGWKILARLSSLIMVAMDCQVPSLECSIPDHRSGSVQEAIDQLTSRNAIITLVPRGDDEPMSLPPVFFVIAKDEEFICVSDAHNENRYSIFTTGIEGNVDRASRCAYLIAAALGFSSSFSFEARFSVYELLDNVVEHGLKPEAREWVQVDLERNEDRLLISIVDKGVAFDPTGNADFDLEGYVGAKKRRGLGLIMTRRIAEQIAYKRESGLNKVIIKKSISSRDAASRTEKEEFMAQFEVSGLKALGDGSHILILSGDLDTRGALVMEQVLSQLMEMKIYRAVFDFEKVPFISSAGVGILLGLVSSLRDAGGDAIFVKISPKVRSVLRLLNLEDYFTIRDSVESSV